MASFKPAFGDMPRKLMPIHYGLNLSGINDAGPRNHCRGCLHTLISKGSFDEG